MIAEAFNAVTCVVVLVNAWLTRRAWRRFEATTASLRRRIADLECATALPGTRTTWRA